jgi:glycosyltransferase involved in cell wall biosynthesis
MNITVVVPRYGREILAGAETLARSTAQRLAQWHRVIVLTTTALDRVTWRSCLPAGAGVDGPVPVLRFAPERERSTYWRELNRLLERDFVRGGSAAQGTAPSYRGLERWPVTLQEEYLRWQGPFPPQLLAWLRAHAAEQDRILFFTYLHPTSYFGIQCVPPEKVDWYPTLHDEAPAQCLPVLARCFHRADRVIFCTEAERRLAIRLHRLRPEAGIVLGRDLESLAHVNGLGSAEHPFLLFAGRIDSSTGVPTLIDYFIRWRAERPQHRLRLVLVGEVATDVPQHPDIQPLGHASEAGRLTLLRHARALVSPSAFERLGLVVLEAFLSATPALVRSRNAVLLSHCQLSNGGLWYNDYPEFAASLSWFAEHPAEAQTLGAQGRAYAEALYGVATYEQRLLALYPPEHVTCGGRI